MRTLAWTTALLAAVRASTPAPGTGDGAPPPAGPLTVEDAVALALERNPDLGAARSRIEAALAGIEAARTRVRTTEVSARLDVERASVELARALGRFGSGTPGAAGGTR